MKIAVITDTHLGARNGSKVFRQYFANYYRDVLFPYLSENGIHDLIHAGDFFDDRSKISVADLNYVSKEFIPLLEEHGVRMHIIAGNHDVMYRNSNDVTALSVFSECSKVHVIDKKIEELNFSIDTNYKVIMCPWMHNDSEDEFVEELKTRADPNTILFGHFQIAGTKMYAHSKVNEDGLQGSIFKRYKNVYSGHFHHPSNYGNITYLGALFYYTWEDYGDWRGFRVLDLDTGEMEMIANESCLFSRLNYTDLDDVSKEELKEEVESKIVELHLDKEYNKIEVKELISNIESFKPISLDVVDETIIEAVIDTDSDQQNSKEIKEYFYDTIELNQNKQELKLLFEDVYERAKANMKEIE